MNFPCLPFVFHDIKNISKIIMYTRDQIIRKPKYLNCFSYFGERQMTKHLAIIFYKSLRLDKTKGLCIMCCHDVKTFLCCVFYTAVFRFLT